MATTTKPKPTKPKSANPGSSDLQTLAASLGIDSTALAQFAATQTTNDPPVWDGRVQRTTSSVYADFYKLDRADMEAFQEQAYNAGLYGNLRRDQVRFGDHDEDTFQVWRNLVDRSAGFTAAGKKISPWDALHEAALTGKPTETNPLVTTVSSPVDIRAGIRSAAKDVLGQGSLDDATVEQIVARYQSLQRGADTALHSAGTAGGDVTAAPGLESFAREQVRASDPVKADSYAVAGTIDQIASLMRGEG